jgi:outer membrane protein assembly factor BamB
MREGRLDFRAAGLRPAAHGAGRCRREPLRGRTARASRAQGRADVRGRPAGGRSSSARGPWTVLAAAALLSHCAVAPAADWPQFQGPHGTGVSPETGLARSWPDGGPPVLWTVDLGAGFGSAAVRQGKVYVLDRVGNRQDVLRRLDLATGRQDWTFAYDAPGELPYNGSRQAPTVEADAIFTTGPFGNLYAIDPATHQPIWSRHVVKDFQEPGAPKADQPVLPTWGFTQRPAFYKDTLILAPLGPKVGLVAYEKATGKVRWKSPPLGPGTFCYASPYLVALCGVDQVVVFTNTKVDAWVPAIISSVDAATGKVLWTLQTWKPYKLPISNPVKIGEDRLFIAGAYGVGCFALKVKKDGQAWSAEYAFKDNNNCVAHLHTPVLYKGRLYANSFDIHAPGKAAGLVCLDLEGNLKWKSAPAATFDAGGFLIADDLIFVMHGKTGELTLVEAAADAFKPLAKARVLKADGGTVWAPLALADGRLIVRDLHEMKCLDVRKPKN